MMEVYKEKNKKIKGSIYQRKKDVNEQFERKLNQDIDVNRKLFKKEVSDVNGENWKVSA